MILSSLVGRSGVFTPRRAVCPGQGPGRGRIGLHHARPQLFIDTFQIPERTGKKKHKPNSNANNTKPKKSKKLTAPKAPVPKRTPLTPEARREIQRTRQKENRERAKSLEICRHCGEPAIEGQTRCKQCAEKHRISRRAYDGRRHAAAKQHKEDLRGGPTAPDSLSNAIPQTANRTNQPWPIPTNGTTKSRDRQEYNRLRNQRPERKEYYRRRAQEQRQRAKESGLCRHCSKPAIPGQTRCEHCAENHRRSRRRSDANRRATANAIATT